MLRRKSLGFHRPTPPRTTLAVFVEGTMKQPDKKTLSVDLLVLDAGTQSRAAISEETVSDYAEIIEPGKEWPFPPLDVFHDGNQYFVADGFHRDLAAVRQGRASVPCLVHQGTARDALLFGMRANDTHGLRMSQADKRHCVELLLDGDENLTQKQIADIVGVTDRHVRAIVSERKDANRNGSYSEHANDPFGDASDPFREDDGAASSTEAAGQEAHAEELPPRTPRIGTEEPGGNSNGKARTPAEEFTLQKSKTVKTAEALSRAISDLNRLKKNADVITLLAECKSIIGQVKNWPK